jgi:hypothetical protein
MTHPSFNSFIILNSAGSASTGAVFSSADFRDVVIQLTATTDASATIKVQASMSDTPPDFSAAQSATNHWDYIGVYDLNNPNSVIVGSTGITFNGATTEAANTKNLLVNTDYIPWLCITITSYTSGTINAIAHGFKAY